MRTLLTGQPEMPTLLTGQQGTPALCPVNRAFSLFFYFFLAGDYFFFRFFLKKGVSLSLSLSLYTLFGYFVV
jgi:hypothetical protein